MCQWCGEFFKSAHYGAASLHVLFECKVFDDVRADLPDGKCLGDVLRNPAAKPMVREICKHMMVADRDTSGAGGA